MASQVLHGNPANYNVTPATRANGEASALEVDALGNLRISGTLGASTVDQSTFVPATTTGTLSQGVYETTPETLTNNQAAAIGIDVNRNVKVTEATLLAGEDLTNNVVKVEQRFSFAYIAPGQATTVVKGSAGFLHSITFNKAAAATNVTTIYDNASGSGTIIAVPLTTAVVSPITVIYDISFINGLTIITGTANGADMTVSYR